MTVGKSSSFWDAEVTVPTHASWLTELEVRFYVNRSISGSPYRWPLDALQDYLGQTKAERALSIGCGTGALERDLIRRELFGQVDGFDGSIGSIAVARQEARDSGMADRISYFASDFNTPILPAGRYDAVFIHQALHHVSALEKLASAIMRALKPGGYLYLDEYIGPSREDWDDDLIEFHRRIYEKIPLAARKFEQLALPIQPDDPSEAVRSSEILPQISKGFEIAARRDYGGAVLSVLYPAIDWSRAEPGLLEEMIDRDRRELEKGHSYHSVILLRPKKGWAGRAARLQYATVPKLRGLRYRMRRRLGVEKPRW